MKLSSEQQLAVETAQKQLVIHAGPGAGKTRVLVERYMRHVTVDKVSPERILTLTFTIRAAAEMKDRIVQRLRAAGLHSEARLAQAGPISTIHGFCERVLREFPFDAGIDPKFEVLTDGAKAPLILKCVLSACRNSESLSESAQAFLETALGRNKRAGVNQRSTENLIDWVRQTMDMLRTAGRTPDEIEALCTKDALKKQWIAEIGQEIEKRTGTALPEGWENSRSEIAAKLKSQKVKLPSWFSSYDLESEERILGLSVGLLDITNRAWRLYLQELDDMRVLDFNEMETRVCQMLESKPGLLAKKYDFLIVDEAQDLNPLQYRILVALGIQNNLLVGDPQQSIYRFRGAERNLFVEAIRKNDSVPLHTNYRSTGRILKAAKEFFATKWVDYHDMQLPDQIESEDAFEDSLSNHGDEVEVWRLGMDSASSVAEGISKLIEEGKEPREITVLVHVNREVDEIASAIRRFGIDVTVADSGQVFFLRDEIHDLGNALRAVVNPANDLSLLALLRSPLVGLSLSGLMRVGLDAKSDGTPIYRQLSIAKGLTPKDSVVLEQFLAWFQKLSFHADRLPAWELLVDLVRHCNLEARAAFMDGGRQTLANARKLISEAMNNPSANGREFADWIDSQYRIKAKSHDAPTLSEDANAVRITTVHKAKGLEWDTVVLVAAARPFGTGDVQLNPETGAVALKVGNMKSTYWDMLKEKRDEGEKHELERLLFVAMTRAKSRLCIALSQNTKKCVWGPSLARQFVPKWESNSWLKVVDLREAQIPMTEFRQGLSDSEEKIAQE